METHRSSPQEPSGRRREGKRAPSEPTPIYEDVLRDVDQHAASPAPSGPPRADDDPADDVTGTAGGHTGEPDRSAAASGGR